MHEWHQDRRNRGAGHLSTLILAYRLILFQTGRGADYANHVTNCPPYCRTFEAPAALNGNYYGKMSSILVRQLKLDIASISTLFLTLFDNENETNDNLFWSTIKKSKKNHGKMSSILTT